MVELQKAGCGIVAICAPNSKVHEFLTSHGVQCSPYPGTSKVSPRNIRHLRMLCEREQAANVHVHFHRDIWNASLALRSDRRRKLFLSIYMGVGKKNDPLHRFIYGRVDAMFSSSDELNRRLPQLYPVSANKIHLLPYGRNLGEYAVDVVKRSDIRASLEVGSGEILAGTIVRIDPGKGALDFAKSILYLDDEETSRIKFVIVGEPTRKARGSPSESPFERGAEDYLGELREFIREHGLEKRVLLAGYQPDVVGWLSAMDLFVFPSRDEMYSLVVLDAMSMGLPIVAAKAGGTLLQIEDGNNGLLYEVGNGRDLAAKLREYVLSPNLRSEHGAAARRFVELHHSMKETIETLLTYYGRDLTDT